MSQLKQNQLPRKYETVNGFELRKGKFYNPNEGIAGTPIQFEIRILHQDPELVNIIYEKIKELIS